MSWRSFRTCLISAEAGASKHRAAQRSLMKWEMQPEGLMESKQWVVLKSNQE